jgi:hypothetical protein
MARQVAMAVVACSLLLALCPSGGSGVNTTTAPPRLHCHVQKDTLYNTSDRFARNYDLPYPDELYPFETLGEAICCDHLFSYFAEPEDFFARPDVNLFAQLNRTGLTTFYDSACGIPLFVAPQNRTFEQWYNESLHHNWPSFRAAEVVPGNVLITANAEVVSRCGTHLGKRAAPPANPLASLPFLTGVPTPFAGTNDPDALGVRYCLDLVCISGRPVPSQPGMEEH